MAKKDVLTTSDFIPYDEFLKLRNYLKADKEYLWELYVLLSFSTACRASDVRRFHWNEILSSVITVKEKKTDKSRKIYLGKEVQQAINEIYELLERPHKSTLVFVSHRTNQPITIQYINKKLKEFKEKYNLKIDNFSTHSFRKGFGRYLYEIGHKNPDSLVLLNTILNHQSIAVTKTYIGVTQDEIRAAYESIHL